MPGFRHRHRFLAFFEDDMLDEDTFLVSVGDSKQTDEQIKDSVEEEGPRILIPKATDTFARSRWLGGQEAIESTGLLATTKNLMKWCVLPWLGVSVDRSILGLDMVPVPRDVGVQSEDEASHKQQCDVIGSAYQRS